MRRLQALVALAAVALASAIGTQAASASQAVSIKCLPSACRPADVPKGIEWFGNGSNPALGYWEMAPAPLVAAIVAIERRNATSPAYQKYNPGTGYLKYLTTPANDFYTYISQDMRHPSWYEFDVEASYKFWRSIGSEDWGAAGIAELGPKGWWVAYGPSNQGGCPCPGIPKAVLNDIWDTY